jgi:glycolate oxidase iron-sulfur subunit
MRSAEPNPHPALAGADLCVKCGACLPVCPTYGLNRDEADSPRGRVGLMQGLARGALSPTAALAAHLDGCTNCRACETVCPAQVPVERVVDAARAMLRSAGLPLPWPTRLALAAARDGWLARTLVAPLMLLQRLGLLAPAAAVFGARWRALAETLPRLRLTDGPTDAVTAAPRLRLSIGCLAPRIDAATLSAARAVLARLGQPGQLATGCCGALARHSGRPDEADALRTQLRGDGTPLLCSATGCAAELGGDGLELTAWLAAARFPSGLAWATAPLTVAVHVPCTQRHALRDMDASERLLARMPGVRVVARIDQGCCGAAGDQLLGNPAQADALGDVQARALADSGAEIVVSPNWGCARHLAARAHAAGRALAPVHPVTLLARRLGLRC